MFPDARARKRPPDAQFAIEVFDHHLLFFLSSLGVCLRSAHAAQPPATAGRGPRVRVLSSDADGVPDTIAMFHRATQDNLAHSPIRWQRLSSMIW